MKSRLLVIQETPRNKKCRLAIWVFALLRWKLRYDQTPHGQKWILRFRDQTYIIVIGYNMIPFDFEGVFPFGNLCPSKRALIHDLKDSKTWSSKNTKIPRQSTIIWHYPTLSNNIKNVSTFVQTYFRFAKIYLGLPIIKIFQDLEAFIEIPPRCFPLYFWKRSRLKTALDHQT